MQPAERFLQLRALVSSIEQRVDGRLVHGAAIHEIVLLKAIREAGPDGIRRQDVAAAVHLSPSGVTRAIQPLEKIGYVETLEPQATGDPLKWSDARVRRVRMTPNGAELFDEMYRDFEQKIAFLKSEIDAVLG